MTANSVPVYGLVLAGGESRRMGQDKALLQRDGQSQLARLVRLLEGMVDRVFVSTRAAQQADPERARFSQIIDKYQQMGPLAGILSAQEEYPQADWVVVACDLPNVDESTLACLLAQKSTKHPFSAFISSHDGLPEPLCAYYRCGSNAVLREFADQGIHCPRKILIRSDTHLLEQPDPHALDNVNTPEDLADSVLEVRP